MKEMININLPKYWEKPLRPGERFNVEDEHVEIFHLAGIAKFPPLPKAAPADASREEPIQQQTGTRATARAARGLAKSAE